MVEMIITMGGGQLVMYTRDGLLLGMKRDVFVVQ
jgi:hypothetical protein